MPLDPDATATVAAAITALGRARPAGFVKSLLEARTRTTIAKLHGKAIIDACHAAKQTEAHLEVRHEETTKGLRLHLRLHPSGGGHG